MCIPVVLKCGREECVSKDKLQILLVDQQVSLFKRSDGWAVVGRDKIRSHKEPITVKEILMYDMHASENIIMET